jgi:hypothetical protein
MNVAAARLLATLHRFNQHQRSCVVAVRTRGRYPVGVNQPDETTHKESLSVRPEGARTDQRRVGFYNLEAVLAICHHVFGMNLFREGRP